MPPIRKPKPYDHLSLEGVKHVQFACVACEDTGVNSRGGPCVPCVAAGRVTEVEPENPNEELFG